MNPDSAKNEIATEPLAAVNRGFRNSVTSSIGSSARRSQATNAASTTAVTAKPARVLALPQPWFGASMIVYTSRPIAAVESANPPLSARGASGSREVGTYLATSNPPAAATGAIAKKMLVQSNASSSQPPKIGPSAIAAPVVAPHRPIARARSRRSVNTLEISDSVAGNTIAAPRPITHRATINCPGLDVSPPATLAKPNTASPPSSIPLRPNRSLRLPAASREAANTRLYASTTH